MFNQPTTLFAQTNDQAAASERPWQMDGQPGIRLVLLFCLMSLPLIAVTGRLVYVQCLLPDAFVTDFDRVRESNESTPSRTGRILAADGQVLAYDVERFNLKMHYRWLEEPADGVWLRRQTLSRLTRSERRDRQRIEQESQNVLALRRELWQRLSGLMDSSPELLAKRRMQIQHRIEGRVAGVENRRRERKLQSRQSTLPPGADNGSWWEQAWYKFSAKLTTEPNRMAADPIVIQEELEYHPIADNVPLAVVAEIAANPERYPGLHYEVVTQRVYPLKTSASHIIGSRSGVSVQELATRAIRFALDDPLDYRPGDAIGKTGIERSHDRQLRGLRGLQKVVKNRQGEVVRIQTIRKPRIGSDVQLTLNVALQQRAEALLDDVLGDSSPPQPRSPGNEADPAASPDKSKPQGGCIVAIDVHTGAILAAASAPRFDLNVFSEFDERAWARIMADPRRPMFPRVTQMAVAPGSVFKTLTAVALLESGRIDPDHAIHCQGYLDNPNQHRCYIFRHYGVGHNDVNLSDALCRSCNVYFFTAARRLGPEPIFHWAQRFGFGQPTGVDLPGERRGNLPSPLPPLTVDSNETNGVGSHTRPNRRSPWYPGDTLGLAIGQSRLTVTPLQIARMMAAVSNGGYLVTPHVVNDAVSSLHDPTESDIDEAHSHDADIVHRHGSATRPRRIPGLSESTLERIREGLTKVVAHPRGTGYKRVRLTEINIAGKTGTAEVGGGKKDHAWFAGYVPAEQPRIAFAVVLENAGSGGQMAGPVARKLVKSMLDLEILRPKQLTARK